MAIYGSVPLSSEQSGASLIDIDAWTVSELQSLNVSTSAVGSGVTLSIPLGASHEEKSSLPKPALRRKTFPRDSQKRREALLKGKEGSRRRQRWENGTWICYG